ncbi:MAG: B12-binding domain-containing radical SAM protein [Bacteroidetes bacterium]|nr:B12-binding domain-containing radical SAM protein [Bacteroidota bacterium]
MKILITHSYFLQFDPKQKELGQPYPPVGTLYAAAMLSENNYEVSFFDTMFSQSAGEIIAAFEKKQPDIFVIYDDGFNYLTKMCLSNMREAAFQMVKLAKQKNCIVIVSSSDSSDNCEQYLKNGADYIIIGEAEQTLLELTDSLKNKTRSIENIGGLVYYNNNVLFKTAKRDVMRNLDSLPVPAWNLINMEPYKQTWLNKYGYFSLNMATTRGCPYKCNWCAKPIYGNRYNTRSPQNVIHELLLLKDKFKFDHIWFCDDIFGLKPTWVEEFSKLVKQHNLKLRYKIQSRADLLVQENYVKYLAESGCDSVWVGAESGSQKILDAMEKGITVEQIYKAVNLLKHYGIKPSLFLQFGYLGETKEDIELTIKMVNDLLPEDIGVSVSYPLPGTKFYEKVKEELKEKSNWTDSDELVLMFKNTYSPAFYRQLHRYVHKNYRKHQGYESLKRLFTQPAKTNFKTLKRAASVFYYIPTAIVEKNKLKISKNS